MLLVACGAADGSALPPRGPVLPPPRHVPAEPSAIVESSSADVVARVGSKALALPEVQRRARMFLLITGSVDAEQEWFAAALDMLIDEEMLLAEAERLGVGVTEKEVDERLETLAASDPDAFWRDQRHNGWTEADYRIFVWRRMVERRVLDVEVGRRIRMESPDEKAVFEYWTSHEPIPDLRVLLIPDDATQLRHAENLARRAESGEDFCVLVSQFSIDPRGRGSCGRLDARLLRDEAERLASVVATLSEGATSPLFTMDRTLAILKIAKAPRSFGEAARALQYVRYRTSRAAAEADWIARLRGRYRVWVNVVHYPFLAGVRPVQPSPPW